MIMLMQKWDRDYPYLVKSYSGCQNDNHKLVVVLFKLGVPHGPVVKADSTHEDGLHGSIPGAGRGKYYRVLGILISDT